MSYKPFCLGCLVPLAYGCLTRRRIARSGVEYLGRAKIPRPMADISCVWTALQFRNKNLWIGCDWLYWANLVSFESVYLERIRINCRKCCVSLCSWSRVTAFGGIGASLSLHVLCFVAECVVEYVYLLLYFKKLTLASGSFNLMNVTQIAEQAEDLKLQGEAAEDNCLAFYLCYVCGTH